MLEMSSFSHFFTPVCSWRLLCFGLLCEAQSDYCNLLKSAPTKRPVLVPVFVFIFLLYSVISHSTRAQHRIDSHPVAALLCFEHSAFTNLCHLPMSGNAFCFLCFLHTVCHIRLRVWSAPHLPVLMSRVQ